MKGKLKNRRFAVTAKLALVLGVLILIVWSVLGTSASLAWFRDEAPPVTNVIDFAEFDLDVSYKNQFMSDYEEVLIDTNVFGEEPLYEPGYTQVVYLKVKNSGDVDMRYRLSIDVRGVAVVPSVLGNEIYLPNYLRYGVLFGDDEAALDREMAQAAAPNEMGELQFNHFSEWDSVVVASGEERYIALVVYMPKEVGNVANPAGKEGPSVTLGLTIYAEQIKN